MSGTSAAPQPPAGAPRPVRRPDAPAHGGLHGTHCEQCFGRGEDQARRPHPASRAGALPTRAGAARFAGRGRAEEIRAVQDGPDRMRRLRAFEVTP
nr:hypothetical protein [Streptomyces roseirectus]